MSYTYRDYQAECAQSVLDDLPRYRSTLAVLPTGAGKSIVIHKIIADHLAAIPGGRVLVMVHKTELIQQLSATLGDVHGAKLVVEQAERIELQQHTDFDIAVCSIQTLLSRPEVIDEIPFTLLLIDETHRALADGYLSVLERLGMTQMHGPALVGFTATDFRGDKQPLSFLYNQVSFRRDILWGIRESWLVPIKARRLKMTEVDANGNVQQRVLEGSELHQGVLDEFRTHCMDGNEIVRPTLIMAGSIDEGRTIAQLFRDEGVEAQMVDSKMDQKLRAEHIQRFRDGELDVLCAMNVLIEGFDAPRASALFWVRNTQSPVTFAQGLGRITRPYFEDAALFSAFNQAVDAGARKALITQSAKTDALFFDCTDATSRYNLATIGTFVGLHRNFDFEGLDMVEVVSEIDELEEAYQVVSADQFTSAIQIAQVAEDAELWRTAITPNQDVPASAQLVYTKHRDHWLLTFPFQVPEHDTQVRRVVKIRQGARGNWTATLEQPDVWKEWYWNGSRKRYMQKFYRGVGHPDTSKTISKGAKKVERYVQIIGMPPIVIAEAITKPALFDAVESYLSDEYGNDTWRLISQAAQWRHRPPSPRQQKILTKIRKAGIALPDHIDSGTASILTDRFFMGLLQPPRLKQ